MKDIIKYFLEHPEVTYSGMGTTLLFTISGIIINRFKKNKNKLSSEEIYNNAIKIGDVKGKNHIHNTVNVGTNLPDIDIVQDMINEADGLLEKKILQKQ